VDDTRRIESELVFRAYVQVYGNAPGKCIAWHNHVQSPVIIEIAKFNSTWLHACDGRYFKRRQKIAVPNPHQNRYGFAIEIGDCQIKKGVAVEVTCGN